MKTKLYQLTLFITALFIFGCTSSDDDLPSENSSTIKQTEPVFMKFHDLIQQETAKLNDNGLFKSENNGNGVKMAAFYSNDDVNWFADFPIYDKDGNLTQLLTIRFPQNGEDRALVFDDTHMMVNFNSHDPRMIIWDPSTGAVTYSNYCEENVSGFYKGRGKTEYWIPEWEPNIYFWGPYAGTEGDDNYIFNIKSTLYPASGYIYDNWCSDSPISGSVDISYTYQGQNGEIRQTFTMR